MNEVSKQERNKMFSGILDEIPKLNYGGLKVLFTEGEIHPMRNCFLNRFPFYDIGVVMVE